MARYRRFVLMRRGTDDVVATLAVAPEETLYDVVERYGFPIRTTCRGSHVCGLCRVHVEEGLETLPPMSEEEATILKRTRRDAPDARLACQLRLPDGVDRMVVSTDYWGEEP